MRVRAPRLALLLAVAACNRNGGQDTGFTTLPQVTSVAETTGGSSTSTSTSTSGSGSSEGGSSAASTTSSTGTTLDMGPIPDFPPAQPEGCKGKIDFLFLISRYGTMHQEQAALIASFPGFINTIEQTFPEFDVHIMVANPDGDWCGWTCEEVPQLCPMNNNCGPNAPGYKCNSWDLMTPCEEVMGAGVLYNAGGYATNYPCELKDGRRYITSEEPDLLGQFECTARVGGSCGLPPIGDALIAAVAPEINGPGGCNEGFLRDDALLVVTLIEDMYDQESWAKPAEWYEAVVAAKGGDPNAIVVFAVIPGPKLTPDQTCIPTDDTPDNNPIRQFGVMFPYYKQENTCAPSYAPAFQEAADLVEEACAKYIPQ